MKTLFGFCLAIFTLSVHAQITFDYSPPLSFIKFTTTGLGEKYVSEQELSNLPTNDTVIIYNSDWSVYRTVFLPTGYLYTQVFANDANGGVEYVSSMSDNLFNSDSLIEFLALLPLGNYISTLAVINELGQIDYTFPDTVYASPYLFTIGGNYKLWYYAYTSTFDTTIGHLKTPKIYSLPGSLPCSQCNNNVSGITGPGAAPGTAALIAYPNPFSHSVVIEYNLQSGTNGQLILTSIDGRELRSIVLNNQSDKIIINTNDLPAGVILVSLVGDKGQLVSKKLVKVR